MWTTEPLVGYLPEVIPFAFGVFPWASTAADRERETERLLAEYERLSNQLGMISNEQLHLNKQLTSSFRIIARDISRTDRSRDGFRTPDALGNVWSGKLLRMYCLFQPSVAFLQGMNDLLQPLMVAFFQRWDWGAADGADAILAVVFWCFDALLTATGQFAFLQNVSNSCKAVAGRVREIFAKVAPAFLVWMKVAALEKLLWMHSDLALLFKRTFENVWDLWIRIACAPNPRQWLAYLSGAFLLMTFPRLTQMAELSLASLGDEFPEILRGIDIAEVAKVALWLCEQLPPETEDDIQPAEDHTFEFFIPQ